MQRPWLSSPSHSRPPGFGGDRATSPLDNEVVRRARGLYLEMPGLRLTVPQARRLLGVDAAECERALDALVGLAFLERAAGGAYRRASDGPDVRSGA